MPSPAGCLSVHALARVRRLPSSGIRSLVWRGGDGGRAMALLALSCRFRSELVGNSGATQRPSIGKAGSLPLDSASHVCLHLAFWSWAGIAVAKLACRMVCFPDVCPYVFCSHASRRTHDVRVLWAGVS